MNSKNSLHMIVASKLSFSKIITEDNTVSFLKMFEGRLTTQYCEAGENTKIQRVVSDYMHSNIAYVLTEEN